MIYRTPYRIIPKFVEDDDYHALDMDVLTNEKILAVSVYNRVNYKTFIDLFQIPANDPQSLQPIGTIDFNRVDSKTNRYICLGNEGKLVTCIQNQVELYLYKIENNGMTYHRDISQHLDGEIRCMVIGSSRVFVASSSKKVTELDFRLNILSKIELQQWKFFDSTWDFSVFEDNFIILSYLGIAAIFKQKDGAREMEIAKPTNNFIVPLSIALDRNRSLIFILWGKGTFMGILASNRTRIVVVHSIKKGEIWGAFRVADGSRRIRFDCSSRVLYVLTWRTGQMHAFDTVSPTH